MPIQVSANEITLIQVNDGQNSKENESKHSILAFVQAHKCVEDSFEVAFEFSHVWGRSRFWIKDWCMKDTYLKYWMSWPQRVNNDNLTQIWTCVFRVPS